MLLAYFLGVILRGTDPVIVTRTLTLGEAGEQTSLNAAHIGVLFVDTRDHELMFEAQGCRATRVWERVRIPETMLTHHFERSRALIGGARSTLCGGV